MAQNKIINIEPIAITGSAANLLNPGITSLSGPVGYTQTQPYLLIKHIRIVNTTSGSLTVSLFKGATGGSAAGTEFAYSATAVAANSSVDWYGLLRLDSADFLTGVGSSTGLTFNAEGEIGLS